MSISRKASTPRSARPLCLGNMAWTVRSVLEQSSLTSFAEVADRVLDAIGSVEIGSSGDQRTLRRRVYDVLNVFCAMGLIAKDAKSIRYHPIRGLGGGPDVGEQVRARLLVKERVLRDRMRMFLGHRLLMERNHARAQTGGAVRLPAIFIGFSDVAGGEVQRALDGRKLEIIAPSAPRFFSPMNLFDAFRFPAEDQVRVLRQMPEFAPIEPLLFPPAEAPARERGARAAR
jgi:hypothetical protein